LEEKMPATEEDVVRLRAAYEAMRSGDVNPLAELMDENIRWIGNESLGDPPPECNGRAEASDMLLGAVDRMPARDIESVAIAGDRILSVARWHEGQGPPGVDHVYNLLTMRDGRIVKMEDFFDRPAAERAFSAPT
jgi:ketosteroid isomerase-like protein